MKTKVTTSKRLVKVSESVLLSLVASKLRGRELFPKKVESARKFVQQANAAKA